MQNFPTFSFDIYNQISLGETFKVFFPLELGDRVFFFGELGSGKTTFIRRLLAEHLNDPDLIIRSPTYTYYQKYGKNIYHFDLYRLDNPEDLLLIGAMDIFGQPDTICLIEWPNILNDIVEPTKILSINGSGTFRDYSYGYKTIR